MATSAGLARFPLFRTLKYICLTGMALVFVLVGYSIYIVQRFDQVTLPARYGQVDTELFVPRESGTADTSSKITVRKPLIIGLGGAEGGNSWARKQWQVQRERFLAQGYAFLAIGYFGGENSPTHLDRIALEGVYAAIQSAWKDPRVRPGCVALIGGSKGAELALLMASHYPEVQATVALAPGNAVFPSITDAMVTSSFAYNKKALAFIPMPWSATLDLLKGDLRAVFQRMLDDKTSFEEAAISVERIRGPLLLVSATEDEFWPSKEMSDAIMHRLAQHQFAYSHQHLPVGGKHAEVLDAFPDIEAWLAEHYPSSAECRLSITP